MRAFFSHRTYINWRRVSDSDGRTVKAVAGVTARSYRPLSQPAVHLGQQFRFQRLWIAGLFLQNVYNK